MVSFPVLSAMFSKKPEKKHIVGLCGEKAAEDLSFLRAMVNDGDDEGDEEKNTINGKQTLNTTPSTESVTPRSNLKEFCIYVFNDVTRMEQEKCFKNVVKRWKVPEGISASTAANACRKACRKGYDFKVEKVASLNYIVTRIC